MDKLTPGMILVCLLLFLLAIYMFSSCSLKCNPSESYAPTGYNDECEFAIQSCGFNSGQTCTLSGNRPGNCTLHGLCCPSFSTDSSRMQELGLTNNQLGARYQQMLEDDNYD